MTADGQSDFAKMSKGGLQHEGTKITQSGTKKPKQGKQG
jgi:hypothetical protein